MGSRGSVGDPPTACIIGAGSSGIVAVKVLRERGIPVECFEKSDRIGGNWVFGNRNGMSAVYRTLHINTSKAVMAYSDFPVDDELPDFPHHSDVLRYFEAYADRFGLRSTIEFETTVENASRNGDGTWEVTLDSGEARQYDVLFVANGHHWKPAWPEPADPGSFDGELMHSHDFVDAQPFTGKRVVVVGMGNSAMDIAVECSYLAERTVLSARRGAHIIPNYILGKPMDEWPSNPRVPFRVRRHVSGVGLRLLFGPPERCGLPKPDHLFGQASPTISSYIVPRINEGAIVPRPGIRSLAGDRVEFVDGSSEQADVVIYCTGYHVSFPFFDPEFVSAPGNDLPLYRRVFHPEHPNLFFIGLLQPWGAIMPLAEAQSKLVAAYLLGEYALPPRAAMIDDIERERRAMSKRYVASKRHTMMVDAPDYLMSLGRESQAGGERAAAAGWRRPVAAREGAGNPPTPAAEARPFL